MIDEQAILNQQYANACDENKKINNTCEWTYDNGIDSYIGDCDIHWQFITGGVEENELIYCPKCGGKVVQNGIRSIFG